MSGEGEVEGAPDTLSVDLAVTIKRPTVGEAVAASADVSTAVVDAVKGQGVTEKDVQTRNYSVNQEFRYPQSGTRRARRLPREQHGDGDACGTSPTAGSVIDAATSAGGDDLRVDTVAFSLENDGPALTAAREKAFQDAQDKAKQYAQLADVPLGDAQAISDVVVTPIAQQYTGDAARLALPADSASTPVEPGQVTTRVTVNTRFQLG